jgi:autotransporter-associated beta strand protein
MPKVAQPRVRSSIIHACAASAAALLLGTAYASAQTQLLLNPGFEAGVAGSPNAGAGDMPMQATPGGAPTGPWLGWNNWNYPYSGYYTAQIPARTGTQVAKTYSAPNGGIYQFVSVIGGDAYTASAYFDNTTVLPQDTLQLGQTCDVRMIFFSGPGGTGTNLGTVVSAGTVTPATPTDTWTQLQVQAAAPTGAQSVQWMTFFNNPFHFGGAMFVDDASLLDTSWNGGGTSNNWSDNNNWGGVAPGQYAPVVFAGNTRLNSVNDSTPGTPYYGIAFQPSAASFTITGNQANLASDVVNNSANPQTIAMDLGLQQDTNFNAAAGNLTVSGDIGGAFAVNKTGSHTLTLSGPNTYGGATNVNAGTLVVGSAAALPATTALNINNNSTAQLATGIGGPTIASLSISPNATLDINNDHLFINYGSGTDPIASIQALLVTGRNGGAWNGIGGITSSAIAGNPGYGVGYADSADPGNPASLSSGTIEVAFTLLGDTNLDHAVNGVDFGILAANFNKGITGWDNGDFNYDNVVNGVDFGSLAANFNKGAASASDLAALDSFAAANGLLADVPEPASVGLLLLGIAPLLSRRRRQKNGE